MYLKQQNMAAMTRHLFRTVARVIAGAAACGGALLLSACVSGTSADLACKNNSADNALSGDIKGNVVVPRNAPPGPYIVRAGMFGPSGRAKARAPRAQIVDDGVAVSALEVAP